MTMTFTTDQLEMAADVATLARTPVGHVVPVEHVEDLTIAHAFGGRRRVHAVCTCGEWEATLVTSPQLLPAALLAVRAEWREAHAAGC